MVNARDKGAQGERDVCALMNDMVRQVRGRMNMDQLDPKPFQRNQNQTAVGGSDISNPFGLSIEVKRQEQLNLKAWWKQTVTSAEQEKGTPILIYRQNSKPGWKVRMEVFLQVAVDNQLTVVAEMEQQFFEQWFQHYYYNLILKEIRNGTPIKQ